MKRVSIAAAARERRNDKELIICIALRMQKANSLHFSSRIVSDFATLVVHTHSIPYTSPANLAIKATQLSQLEENPEGRTTSKLEGGTLRRSFLHSLQLTSPFRSLKTSFPAPGQFTAHNERQQSSSPLCRSKDGCRSRTDFYTTTTAS